MQRDSAVGRLLLLTAIVSLVVLGCARPQDSKRADSEARAEARRARLAKRAAERRAPLRIEECRQFTIQMEWAIREGDERSVRALIDWPAVYDTATQGLAGAAEFREPFLRGYFQGVASDDPQATDFIRELMTGIAAGGDYALLHIHGDGHQSRVCFRFIPADGGVIYHDFHLVRSGDGEVRANDVSIPTAGGSLSEIWRPLVVELVEHKSRGVLARLQGQQSLYLKHLVEIRQMLSMQQTNPRAALRIYRKLPQELREMKMLMLARLRIGAGISEDEYLAAIADIERCHNQDGSLEAVLLDGYFLTKRWSEAMRCVDALDRRVGGDPYLGTIRTTVLLELGRVEDARREIDRTVQLLPQLRDGYLTELSVALAERNFSRVTELFEILKSQFEMKISDPATVPGYEEFVTSPEYDDWLYGQGVARYEPWPRVVQ